MAFSPLHLTLMAHGGGQQWWSYRSTDTQSVVATAGYFTGEAVDMLKVGDLVFSQEVDNLNNPSVVVANGWHVVNFNDGETVDITDATSVSLTDTG